MFHAFGMGKLPSMVLQKRCIWNTMTRRLTKLNTFCLKRDCHERFSVRVKVIHRANVLWGSKEFGINFAWQHFLYNVFFHCGMSFSCDISRAWWLTGEGANSVTKDCKLCLSVISLFLASTQNVGQPDYCTYKVGQVVPGPILWSSVSLSGVGGLCMCSFTCVVLRLISVAKLWSLSRTMKLILNLQ